jgi:hypothetical protein
MSLFEDKNDIDFMAAMKGDVVRPVPDVTILEWSKKWDLEVCKTRFDELFKERISEMKELADKIEVKTPDDDKVVVQLGTAAKGLTKRVKDTMDRILGENEIQLVLNYVDGVKAVAKMFVSDFDGIERTSRKKHADFQYLLELERRKLEQKQREERDRLQKEMNEKAKAAKVVAPILPTPSVSKEQPVVRTESGSASIRTEWVFRLRSENIDNLLRNIPLKYWKVQYEADYDAKPPKLPSIVLDSALIRADIKSGIREIPGIEVYERPVSIFRSGG